MEVWFEDVDYWITVDDKEYNCYVNAHGNYAYDPGRMYYADGTGCPPDEELDITRLDVNDLEVQLDDGRLVPVTDEAEKAKVESHIETKLYEMDISRWSHDDEYRYED